MFGKWAKKLTENPGLKILALLLAIILWVAVINLDDPTINKQFTTGVTVENENFISTMGKYYEIESEDMNVTFNVYGKRSVINQLNNSDFKAVADLSQISQDESENRVPVTITPQRSANQVTVTKRVQNIRVKLEDLMRKSFIIQIESQGDPAEGYALDSMGVTPNVLRVSGPKSVVSKIEEVRAVIDVTGMSTEITDNVMPVLYDKDEKAVDITRLTMNLNTVTVRAGVVSEKTVPVKVKYTGSPAEGFEVVALDTDPAEIRIKGDSDILNAIGSITIPEGLINVEGMEEKLKQQVDITKYLPSGVTLSDSTQASITVTVDIEEMERRVFNVPVSKIEIDNLPEGSTIKFNSKQVGIPIYGLKNDLDALTADSLHPILDVSGMMSGSHVGSLRLILDQKYIAGEATVSYRILTENSPNSGNGDTTADNDENQDSGDSKADQEE